MPVVPKSFCMRAWTKTRSQTSPVMAIRRSWSAPTAIRFYRGECFGLIMDWVMRGMPDNVLVYFHQLCTLRQGMTEHLLRRIHTDTE